MNRPFIMFISLLFLLHSFQGYSFQSLDQLLADPDITWVGEVHVDYHPNTTIENPLNETTQKLHPSLDFNIVQILKIESPPLDDELDVAPNLLCKRIFQFDKNTLNIYKDALLKEKISYQAYQEILQQEIVEKKDDLDPDTYEDIIVDMIVKYEENPSKAQIYQANYYDQLEAFPEKGLQTISRQIDTLITFDINMEKTVNVYDNKLEAKDLAKIRIVQDWVWDERTQTMQIQVLGFSPLRFFFDRPYYKYYSYFHVKAGE